MSNTAFWIGVAGIVLGCLVAFVGGLPLGRRWPRHDLPRVLQLVGAALLFEGVIILWIVARVRAAGPTGPLVGGELLFVLVLAAVGAAIPFFIARQMRRLRAEVSTTSVPSPPTEGIGRRAVRKIGYTVGALALVVGVFVVASPACACLSPAQLEETRFKMAMRGVVALQQARYDSLGRYAPSLDSLPTGQSHLYGDFEITAYSDSSFHLIGRSGPLTRSRCTVDVSPAVGRDPALVCTDQERE